MQVTGLCKYFILPIAIHPSPTRALRQSIPIIMEKAMFPAAAPRLPTKLSRFTDVGLKFNSSNYVMFSLNQVCKLDDTAYAKSKRCYAEQIEFSAFDDKDFL